MFAAIFLPQFRLQAALRFRAELWAQPVALVDEQSGKGLVLEATPPAAAAGVSAGLTSPQAMARCPELRLLPRAPAQEENAGAALLEIAGSLSPDLEATAPGICTVDLSRRRRGADAPSAAVWRTPRPPALERGVRETAADEASAPRSSAPPWCATVLERCAALHLRARLGIAANPDLALLAARRAAPVLVVQNAATFLADLAIAEVDPPPELLSILRDWGIGHLGQLAQVPKDALIDRLGPAAGELWQRAMGGEARLLRLVRPVEEFAETFDFEHEIETVEPLLFILRRFLEQLTQRLATVHRVAGKMTLTIEGTPLFGVPEGHRKLAGGAARNERNPRNHGKTERTPAGVPESSAAPAGANHAGALVRGLRSFLASPPANFRCPSGTPSGDVRSSNFLHQRTFTIPAPTADVEVLFRILHTHLDGLTLEQRPTGVRLTLEPVRADHRQMRLFESPLRDPNRFGETLARLSALVGVERVGVPEPEDTHRPDRCRLVEPRFHTAGEEKDGAPDLTVGLPLRRYRPAFPAQVQLVRHVPAFVFSEKIHGEIVEAAGPYRLSGDWWERERWSAEEWDIELSDGALHRLVKRGDSWFVEGCYDEAIA